MGCNGVSRNGLGQGRLRSMQGYPNGHGRILGVWYGVDRSGF